MIMRYPILLVVLQGCGFEANRDDGTVDARPDALACLGAGAFEVCLDAEPRTAVELTDALDTGTDARCSTTNPASWLASGQPEACFIVGKTITVTNLVATGDRPLVLVATDSLSIAGLDVASHRGLVPGPGARLAPCSMGTAPISMAAVGGGGAGGTLVMPTGESGGIGHAGAVAGGATNAAVEVTKLHAGCRGQTGGAGQGPGGGAGEGGGAAYLLARNSLSMTGMVNASGASGSATLSHQAGGGGGGSGGMIVMHAPVITATGATIFANGAGGASGSAGSGGTSANDPTVTTADGGSGQGGTGGDGSVNGAAATPGGPGTSNKGGGGGGGGAGYLRANVALAGASKVSPAAEIVP